MECLHKALACNKLQYVFTAILILRSLILELLDSVADEIISLKMSACIPGNTSSLPMLNAKS